MNSSSQTPTRLLYSLMITGVIMPLTGWMFSVALPVIRDEFLISPDVAAWIATAFSLPFMILMPIYGRLSDDLGKRRLLIGGTTIFMAGTLLAFLSQNLPMLLLARIVQGFGIAGLLPLSLALITELFPAEQRGWAMGIFSTVGPLTGVVGPLLAGFIVAQLGWRSSFLPPALFALISIGVIYAVIPASGRPFRFDLLKRFDWGGVLLLSLTLTSLFFYISSRPITGVPSLQDWRLLLLTLLFLAGFVWRERRSDNPFLNLRIFKNRSLMVASVCSCLRMMGLSGAGSFLTPLYLADVVNLNPTQSGFYLMAVPAAMVGVVRFGGRFSDRFGSRPVVLAGFSGFAAVMFGLSRITDAAPGWVVIGLLILFGIGAGLMLASLHRAALNDVTEAEMGTSSGVYSMIRFLGSASGAAFAGILLQFYLSQGDTAVLPAYQSTYLWFMGFALIGLLFALFLPGQAESETVKTTKQAVLASYEVWSKSYDSQVNPTRDVSTAVLKSTLPPLAGLRVVEAGCGTGGNSQWIAPQCERLIGLDFSEAMLAWAQEKVSADNAQFIVHDLMKPWPVEEDWADLVLINLVLEHIEQLRPLLTEAGRTIKPGGSVHITEYHPDRVQRGDGAEFDNGKGVTEVINFHHPLEEYMALADTLGFTLEAVQTWGKELDERGRPVETAVKPLLLSMRLRKPSSKPMSVR